MLIVALVLTIIVGIGGGIRGANVSALAWTDGIAAAEGTAETNTFEAGKVVDPQRTNKSESSAIPNEEKRENRQKGSEITIALTYKNRVFHYEDRYITPANHLVAEELHQKRINGSYAQKMEIMNKCLATGGTYKNAVLFTMPRLEAVVDRVIEEIFSPPQNSKIEFDPDDRPMFRIKREVSGVRVNEENLYRNIYASLKLRKNAGITVQTESIAPKITAEDNTKLTRLRARHSTELGRSSENRKDNIKLALRKVNGTVLEEGEEFSFNRIVGRRTETNGFKSSKIIVGGKYEDGVGGGVCQASTTLYNAALLAGLSVTSARNHSLECSYELPSFDAMVNDGFSDLRFRNTEKTPVFIRCYCTETSVVFEIYGAKLDYKIERKSEVVFRGQPPTPETIIDTDHKYHAVGTESGSHLVISSPRGEMKSVGFLLYYDHDGRLIKTEKIREDKYKAVTGLVAIAP